MRVSLVNSNALNIPLADGSVHCVVTSPPYYGLRDYSVSGQLGLEPTLQEYIENTVKWCAEVWRVLRGDGVFWLNLGDSYNGSGGPGSQYDNKHASGLKGDFKKYDNPNKKQPGFKPKDLMLVPHRVAIALQEWGWWVRSDIVWHKPNPMPEPVTDRPTKSHEYIFLLTKNKNYYYDADAIREPAKPDNSVRDRDATKLNNTPGRTKMGGLKTNHYTSRNKRTVWTIATKPYKGAHFACVDEKTECLTKLGWLKYDRLQEGMDIAGFDIQTKTLQWQRLNNVSVYDVENQEMVSVNTRDMSMLLTPNHRCIVRKRTKIKSVSDDYRIARADELNSRSYIPLSSKWAVLYGGVYQEPEFAELMGWFVTDGYIKHGKFACVDQSWAVNRDKCNRIRFLLEYLRADYNYKISKREWKGRSADMMQITIRGEVAERLLALCPGKRVPFGILTWQEESIRAFLNGVIGGDGCTRKDDGRISIIQKSKAFLDDIQAIAVRLGNTANLTQRKDGTWVLYLTDRKYRGLRGTNGKNNVINRRNYTGVVWCPQTELTTFVARRNGKVFITGNTFPPEIPETCIKAGTSEKGVCPVCGNQWERVTDNKLVPTKKAVINPVVDNRDIIGAGTNDQGSKRQRDGHKNGYITAVNTLGWQPTCSHDEESVPATVLDNFGGSGTTAMVANQLGRHGISLDLSPEYLQLAKERTGIKLLQEWEAGKKAEANLEGLPMFEEATNP